MSSASLGITGSINGGGIKHFTNWDASLTSIKYQGKESLESKSPTSFLQDYLFYGNLNQEKQIEFGIGDIKIVDNIAAVAYPEFTDIHKTVHTIHPQNTDDPNDPNAYIPLIIPGKDVYTSPSSKTTQRIFPNGMVVIPIFDFKDLVGQFELDLNKLDLDGLYIVLTYQGDITAVNKNSTTSTSEWINISTLVGKRQILRWCPPGYITSQQNSPLNNFSSDANGYIPPGYFSIRKLTNVSHDSSSAGGCTTIRCDSYNSYYIVANIGLNFDSFPFSNTTPETEDDYKKVAPINSTWFNCRSEQTSTPPETLPPDLFGLSNFEPVKIEDSPSEQLFGLPPCYQCVDGSCEEMIPPIIDCGDFPGTYLTSNCDNACSGGGGGGGSATVICGCCENGFCVDVEYPAGTNCSSVCRQCYNIGGPCGGSDQVDCWQDSGFYSANSAEIKCAKLTLIKYKPVIGCGKVDLYNRKQGNITSLTGGIATSNDHGLLHGDVIKIFATERSGINGVFYIGEIINENSFRIYKEKELITPILEVLSGTAEWYQIDSAQKEKIDNGAVSITTSSTLTAYSKSWTVNEWQNYQVVIYAGRGYGQVRTISSNTSDQLVLSSSWSTSPDSSSLFTIIGSSGGTWKYYGTLFSPKGKNGYSSPINDLDMVFGFDLDKDLISSRILNLAQSKKQSWLRDSTLLSSFNKKRNFDEIFIEDYFSDVEFKYSPAGNYFWNHNKISPNLFESGPVYPRWFLSDQANTNTTLIDLFSVFPLNNYGYSNINDVVSADKPAYFNPLSSRPISTYDSYVDNTDFINDGKIKKSTYYVSGIETADYGVSDVWGSAYNLVNDFRFGCSIDLKKNESTGKYLLLVGERGSNTVLSVSSHKVNKDEFPLYRTHPWEDLTDYTNTFFQLPNYAHGSAYLFEISVDANRNISKLVSDPTNWSSGVSLLNIFTAYSTDDDIASPRPLNVGYVPMNISDSSPGDSFGFKFGSAALSLTKQAIESFLNSFPGNTRLYNRQEIFNDVYDWKNIETKTTDKYWYGGMLLALADIDSGFTYLSNAKQGTIFTLRPNYRTFGSSYYSDLDIPKIKSASEEYYSLSDRLNSKLLTGFYRDAFDIYPYVDSFGKSIALDISNGQVFVFCSSNIKDRVYREGLLNSDDSIFNSYNYVGYIHVFIDNEKTQKIFDDNISVPYAPSRCWASAYYKADKFANCIIVDNNKLYWGQPKTIEINSNEISLEYDLSKIFIYENDQGVFKLRSIIANENDRDISYIVQTNSSEISGRARNVVCDFKEKFLKNKLDRIYQENFAADEIVDNNYYFYPSDRFGNYFKVENDLLITNAFDDRNELEDIHRQIRWPYAQFSEEIPIDTSQYYIEFNRVSDYIHVYKLIDNKWVFAQKIAPSFNYENDKFKDSFITYRNNAINSLRSLGNISYENKNSQTVTWDIDLTGCYEIFENRILIKDPVSLSIFVKDLSLNNKNILINESPISFKTINLQPYFVYNEVFEAQYTAEKIRLGFDTPPCPIEFNSINNMYNYDSFIENSQKVIYRSIEETDGDRTAYTQTPIYFINIPKGDVDYYSIQSLSIFVEEIPNDIGLPPLQMVLYKKDPRQTIYPKYVQITSTCSIKQQEGKLGYGKDFIYFNPYVGGALDMPMYEAGSFSEDSDNMNICGFTGAQGFCLAKLISPATTLSSTNKTKFNEYTINIDDINFTLNDFIVKDNLISSNTRNFSGVTSEELTFDDLSSIGYDSSINIEDSLIVGFIFQSRDYGFNVAGPNFQSEINIANITARIKYNSSEAGTLSPHIRNYNCISTDVKPINDNGIIDRVLNFYENQNHDNNYWPRLETLEIPTLKYNHSYLAISNSNYLPSINDTESDIYPGAYSAARSILSSDEYAIAYTRSFDIQKLETLPLYITGDIVNKFSNQTSLVVATPIELQSNATLYVNAPIGQISTLYVAAPISFDESSILFTRASKFASTPICISPILYINSIYGLNNSSILHTKAAMPRTMSLHTNGPLGSTEGMTLFTSNFYKENNLTTFIDASIPYSSYASLLMKADIASEITSLYIAGPVFIDSLSSKYSTCYIADINFAFDISDSAENIIEGTNKNSISPIKYGVNTQYRYGVNDVDLSVFSQYKIDNNYKFYFEGRQNKSIAANNDYLAIGTNTSNDAAINTSFASDNSPLPEVHVFTLNENKQAELSYIYSNLKNDLESIQEISDFLDSTYFIANIESIAISDQHKIAVSLNVILKEFTGSQHKLNCILILEKINSSWVQTRYIANFVENPDEFQEIGNLIGIHMQWVGEFLFYTQNNQNPQLDSIKMLSPANVNQEIDIDITKTDIYTLEFQQNLSPFSSVEKIHFGFGHKFFVADNLMFVSCPYLHPYFSKHIPEISSIQSPNGAVFIFKFINDSWDFLSTIYYDAISGLNSAADDSSKCYHSKFFGYDIAYDKNSKTLVVGQPGSNKIYRFYVDDSNWSAQETITGERIGTDVSLFNYTEIYLSRSGSGVIYIESLGFSYDSDLTTAELKDYFKASQYSESIVSITPLNKDYLLVARNFYADENIIQKISLLNINTLHVGSLFLKMPDDANGSMNLVIKTPTLSENGLRLRFPRPSGFIEKNATLYISSLETIVAPLYLQAPELTDYYKTFNTFVYGSVVPVSIKSNTSNLFLLGKNNLYKEVLNGAPFYINGPDKDNTINSTTLYIGLIPIEFNNNTTLHTGGSLSNSGVPFNQIVSDGSSLFITNKSVDNNTAPMFIHQKEGGDSMNLFLHNSENSQNFTLYTFATYGYQENISLVIADTVGIEDQQAFIYLNGYRR